MKTTMPTAEKTHELILKLEESLRKRGHLMAPIVRELVEEKIEDLNDEFIIQTNEHNRRNK